MKIESESESTIQAAYSGKSNMTHNRHVNAVLLQDGWHCIIPGSFKLHKTEANVPFVRFTLGNAPIEVYDNREAENHTIEIFPQALHGVAYPTADRPSLATNGESDK